MLWCFVDFTLQNGRAKCTFESEPGVFEDRCMGVWSSVVKRGATVQMGTVTSHTYFPVCFEQERVTIQIHSSKSTDMVYIDNSFLEASLTVNCGSKQISKHGRGIHVEFLFGGTEVQVRVKSAATGDNLEANLKFF